MYKLICIGVDGKLHCCDVSDKTRSCCSENIPVKYVNPDFSKLTQETFWCYECDHLLYLQEEHFSKKEQGS